MDAPLTFAHLSDPHLTSPAGARLRDLVGKRALGYLSWRLRRHRRHRAEILDALVRDLEQVKPDHILISGDLVQLGLRHEFEQARRWLAGLGPPSRLTLVPGNHDLYAATAWDHALRLWAPWVASDVGDGAAAAAGPDGCFPVVRLRGPAAFIGVSSARPSPLFLAVGSVGPDQLRRLERTLAETRGRGLFRVLLIHHPVLAGAVHWRRRLTDAGALRAVLAREGAELVLHGHAHRASIDYLQGGAGSIPVVGVPSASAAGVADDRRARYHLYTLARRSGGFTLTLSVRRHAAGGRFAADGAPRPLAQRA